MLQESFIRILFLEDKIQDVNLMKRELDIVGFKYIAEQVVTKKDFLNALEVFKPDVILADYSLKAFNGMHAFHLLKKQINFSAFILITGVLSEQLALECLSEGVDDFILKSDIKRLPLVITRNLEIKKVELLKESISAELKLKDEELKVLRSSVEEDKIHRLLSEREYEVFYFLASGRSIKEI